MEASLQTLAQDQATPGREGKPQAETKGPSPGLEQEGRKRRSEKLRKVRESIAKANEALWAEWPWKKEGHPPKAVTSTPTLPTVKQRGAFALIFS